MKELPEITSAVENSFLAIDDAIRDIQRLNPSVPFEIVANLREARDLLCKARVWIVRLQNRGEILTAPTATPFRMTKPDGGESWHPSLLDAIRSTGDLRPFRLSSIQCNTVRVLAGGDDEDLVATIDAP